jgi:hypothetical protein
MPWTLAFLACLHKNCSKISRAPFRCIILHRSMTSNMIKVVVGDRRPISLYNSIRRTKWIPLIDVVCLSYSIKYWTKNLIYEMRNICYKSLSCCKSKRYLYAYYLTFVNCIDNSKKIISSSFNVIRTQLPVYQPLPKILISCRCNKNDIIRKSVKNWVLGKYFLDGVFPRPLSLFFYFYFSFARAHVYMNRIFRT